MAISKVSICNLALSTYLGKARINAITEPSSSAQQCELHYDMVRQELLSEWPWSFAIRRQALATMGVNDQEEWLVKYVMPANALRINWVNEPYAAKQAILDREVYDTPRKVENGFIYADLEAAQAEFVLDVDDPTVYPPKFVQAFAALLASRMAIPLTETAQKMQAAMDAYALYLDEAKVNDIQLEEPIRVIQNRDYTEVR